MKKVSRERVRHESYLDGVLKGSFEQTQNVYLRKGEEVVHYVSGYRKINRDENGQAILRVYAKRIHGVIPGSLIHAWTKAKIENAQSQ